MALNGTGTRFVSAVQCNRGIWYTFRCVPVTSYPASGELLSDIIFDALLGGQIKIPAGLRPDQVAVTANLGHVWTYDPAVGTMGSLRNWTAIGATPTEHATDVYGGNEASAVLTVSVLVPFGTTMSR